jgi:tRNA/tmRNA/rRNA uracil-C5-methylase (TrmA/RlmC/RlmD family)
MVRGRPQSPKVGLFQTGSHRIADIPNCRVHHPLVNQLAGALKRAMRATGSIPYAEAPHRGLVRALQVVVERRSTRAQVVVVTLSDSPAPAAALLERLREEAGSALHSLWWNGNPARTNVILGPHWHAHCGPEAVSEAIGGAQVFFPPGAFGQSALDLADTLVQHAQNAVPAGSRVAEYYAGVGAIGLGLLARGHAVAFNEFNPHGLRGLALGLAALPAAVAARAETLAGAAGHHADAVARCDVAIVDPPRKGLDTALLDALSKAPPRRLVYVSCDVGSLASDTRTLLGTGRLRLRELTPYALFPFTEHVETLAIYDRI